MSTTRGRTLGERQSIYFPEKEHEEIKAEAERQGRSFSKIVRLAWTIARERMKKMPGAEVDHGG